MNITERIDTKCFKCGRKYETVRELEALIEKTHEEMQKKRVVQRQKIRRKENPRALIRERKFRGDSQRLITVLVPQA